MRMLITPHAMRCQQSRARAFVPLGTVAALLLVLFALSPNAAAEGDPAAFVPPLIGDNYPNDTDSDRIDDLLQTRQKSAQTKAATDETVEVELVFKQPPTQAQTDAFLAMGGSITYRYQAVSYGWNGRLPLSQVDKVPATMGATLVLVTAPRPAKTHLQLATQCGRARPVWATGFAGNANGFQGDSSITVAIIDTGVDASHTDLTGRRVYWRDFSSDSASAPVDVLHHGTHVTGIATGTGAASGSTTGTLYYTDSGTLSGVSSGNVYPSPIWLPSGSVTLSSTAKWLGGGTTSLYGAYCPIGNATASLSSLSSPAQGASPLTESNSFTVNPANQYMAALVSNGSMSSYSVANTLTNYPAVGDGFNRLSGVAPGCNWAGAKVFSNAGAGTDASIGAAVDALVANRQSLNIKVMNLSIGMDGTPGLDASLRQKINSAVGNGVVVCCSAGNDGSVTSSPQPGSRQVDDPGRAALAITVGATNGVNQVTDYTSWGFPNPGAVAGQEEDYKPDILAPGGSFYYSLVLSADSNACDGESASLAEQRANDYCPMAGTSMASPFVTGCAALVIQAMQRAGATWDFTSSRHARTVKMLLCATATETNASREVSAGGNPTLQRAATGSNSYPTGKDMYEGYGLLNPDAAIEAVTLTYVPTSTASATLDGGYYGKRAWARSVALTAGTAFAPALTVPTAGDFDLYLYSATPSSYGAPVLLASSTKAGTGVAESLSYTAATAQTAYLVVKRVSGTGTFTLSTPSANTPPSFTSVTVTPALARAGTAVTITFTASETLAAAPTVTVNGHAATYQGVSGLVYTYVYSVLASDSDGLATIAISGTDTLGAAGTTTNATSLTVDKAAPSFTAIASTPSLAGLGATVALSFTASEALSAAPTVTVNGHSATPKTQLSTGYVYAYTIQAADQNGAATISLTGSDLAGNLGTTSSTSALAVDRQAPTAQITLTSPSPTGADTILFGVAFSESVASTFTASAISLTGTIQGIVSVTGTDPVYVVSVVLANPNLDGSVGIRVANTVADPYGNAYPGGTSPLCTVANWFGFTANPSGAKRYLGDAYACSVTAHCSSSSLGYEWKLQRATDDTVVNVGGNSPSLTVAPIATTDRGKYWCEVTYDGVVHPSATAELQAEPRITLTNSPNVNTLALGQSRTFSITAAGGYPPLTYQWNKDGVEIPSATQPTYTLSSLTTDDSGTYTVTVRDANTDVATSPGERLDVVTSMPAAGRAALLVLATMMVAAGCSSLSQRRTRR